ncbi:DUF222 domain-containing protein [Micropruina sp.]|uniref:DUF222 domain-containing protein n=1 Tax=Micropruina sp. TaxID=2737536 RepID=UPI0039E60F95
MIPSAAPLQGTAAERLRQAADLRRRADAEELRALADLAAEHSWSTTDEYDVIGGERAVRIGADGSRLIGEFLPMEVAAIKKISVAAATWLIRDVINLEARHPGLWRAVRAGDLEPYKAFTIARLAAGYELSQAQTLAIDEKLATKVGRIGWQRFLRLTRGLIGQVASDAIEAAAKKARESRFVRSAPTDEAVVSELWARLDTTDAQQLEATVQALAKKLGDAGDTDELDLRRAKALGILATPGRAQALLSGSGDQRYLPRTKAYLHLTPGMLTGEAPVARSETLGPITKNMLGELFGTHRITVTPVLHLDGEHAVDSYEIPDRIREAVVVRDVCEVFPYSSRTARNLDLDHTQPYVPGAGSQTAPDNLGPLTRRVHRAKTAGRWRLKQPRAGTFWWKSPRGNEYRVSPSGTDDLCHWSSLERKVAWLLDNR